VSGHRASVALQREGIASCECGTPALPVRTAMAREHKLQRDWQPSECEQSMPAVACSSMEVETCWRSSMGARAYPAGGNGMSVALGEIGRG